MTTLSSEGLLSDIYVSIRPLLYRGVANDVQSVESPEEMSELRGVVP